MPSPTPGSSGTHPDPGSEPASPSTTSNPSAVAEPLVPDSIWKAPQSRLFPSNLTSRRSGPLDAVDAGQEPTEKLRARSETYLRRVTKPELGGPPPTRLQKGSQLLGGVLAVGCVGYAVVWHDFGEKENVFSPIRRILGMHPRGYGYDPMAPPRKDPLISR
ncbi:hypothetical protein K437DRAFT_191422 [Tilletiaria anomala UBC 951]|uniref:Uncharacterized protein n=1 Tax=Tilletiaria anomala (strain ATCC 24038 / CBS 436.72 / UBC 951) TaxID=1037660 RepID=A0A066VFM0_TILAU|nr:uncharacterized protein K437DRAFT_191422 [Tilletiaria anomala UBC 951]KDN40266.1 hypothetical protein K437DRAFT_191422 [Tilletiaria anomala UBC 951]